MSRTALGKLASWIANITVILWAFTLMWSLENFVIDGSWISFVVFLFLANRWVWLISINKKEEPEPLNLDYHFKEPGFRI